MWLEAEVGDAVTRLELPEKSGTVVRNSEAVSSCSGQRRQCTYARTHACREGRPIIASLRTQMKRTGVSRRAGKASA